MAGWFGSGAGDGSLDLPTTQWSGGAGATPPSISSVQKPKDPEASAQYHAKKPSSPYAKFKPDLVDSKGRQYHLVQEGDVLDLQDDVNNKSYGLADLLEARNAKRLLLFCRMPIAQRHLTPLPDPDGEVLDLYHVRLQVSARCKTDGVFFSGQARTGHLFVRDFTSEGPVANPKPFEAWLDAGNEGPGKQYF